MREFEHQQWMQLIGRSHVETRNNVHRIMFVVIVPIYWLDQAVF